MLEVKELQYFVVCADLSSFSRASEVLYTTQPNVSKVIRSLEEKFGFEVFERDNRGIKLTRRGRQAYEYAGKILEQERQLAQIYKIDDREEFSISSNPSSWVARCFTDYYIKYSDENVRYNIMEGSVNSVIERVGTGLDELGFIFFMDNQLQQIEYKLKSIIFNLLSLRIMRLIYIMAIMKHLRIKMLRVILKIKCLFSATKMSLHLIIIGII